jgi:hypothetical protein
MHAQVAFWPNIAGFDMGKYVERLGKLTTTQVCAGEKTWDFSRKGKMSTTKFQDKMVDHLDGHHACKTKYPIHLHNGDDGAIPPN